MTPSLGNKARLRKLALALPYLVAALGFPAVEMLRVVEASPAALIESFNDDAFFYFEIARNLAEGHGSTFDGMARTNGYHPLWMVLLVPVYSAGLDSYQALVAVTCVASALWILTIAGVYRIASSLDAIAWFSPGLILLSYQKELWFGGMETGLLLTILIGVLWRSVKERTFTDEKPGLFGQGFWLAWLPMARLDAVFTVAAYALVFFLKTKGAYHERAKKVALLVAPSAVLLGLVMTLSWTLFGTVTPVSGQAKSLGAPFAHIEVVSNFLLWKPLSTPGVGLLNTGGLLALLIMPAWLFLVFGKKWCRPPAETCLLLEPILSTLLIAQCFQLAYYSVASSWPLWGWYYYYTAVLLLFSLPVCIGTVIWLLPRRRFLSLLLSVLVALGLVIRLQRTLVYSRSQEVATDDNYRTASVDIASRLNRTTPSTSVFAMGDRAGSLAYQLDRPLIHTEGLVNSVSFLAALEAGTVHSFLQERGVGYIVYSGGQHSGGLPQPVSSPAGCARLVEPKFGHGPKFSTVVCDEDLVLALPLRAGDAAGGAYWVWKYRPDLNPG